jgi:hypothetical protein
MFERTVRDVGVAIGGENSSSGACAALKAQSL